MLLERFVFLFCVFPKKKRRKVAPFSKKNIKHHSAGVPVPFRNPKKTILPETNSLPLKTGKLPKRKGIIFLCRRFLDVMLVSGMAHSQKLTHMAS